ncbi:hypothetical protein [Pragia fontium]|uniref:Uncharacterized protein n=1 Tax=Pragia fontium TaxID=82985 RepID=A0ABQ5LIP2_9GAMM|nr:hypothetical protein [Pragia fontium]GKX62832.1 hypothetical protein SOASR032_14010 [Pragia fontium]
MKNQKNTHPAKQYTQKIKNKKQKTNRLKIKQKYYFTYKPMIKSTYYYAKPAGTGQIALLPNPRQNVYTLNQFNVYLTTPVQSYG